MFMSMGKGSFLTLRKLIKLSAYVSYPASMSVRFDLAGQINVLSDCSRHKQARSKQCLIGPAIAKLSPGELGAG